MLETNIPKLEARISAIEERNRRVEADKAWETSLMRKLLILMLTYLVMVIFMYFAKIDKPWASSVVPALAFVLSTMSLTFVKEFWLKRKK